MAHFERLSALDASFLGLEHRSAKMHIAATLVFDAAPLTLPDGRLAFDRIRAVLGSRLHEVPRFRQRLAYVPLEQHPVWVDDPLFHIDDHLHHARLPAPGDRRQLQQLASRIKSQRLDRDKPLWEMWVIEGLQEGRFAIITKVHHCLADGVSGVDLLTVLLRPTPASHFETPPAWQARPAPAAGELLLDALRRRVSAPSRVLGAVGAALLAPRPSAEALYEGALGLLEVARTGLSPCAETPINAAIGPHRRFDWVRFELVDVKLVKRHLGGTINDVVLATVAGAMRSFLDARGARLEAKPFRAMIPVSLRPETERGTLGNRVASMLVDLPLAEGDPRRRLERVVAATRSSKRSNQVQGIALLERLGDWTSSAVLTQLMRMAQRAQPYNVVVTNVPGPQVPLHLLDAPLLEIYPQVPLFEKQAVGIALFSYHGGLFWGINADRELVPDLDLLVEALAREFKELCKAADQDRGKAVSG